MMRAKAFEIILRLRIDTNRDISTSHLPFVFSICIVIEANISNLSYDFASQSSMLSNDILNCNISAYSHPEWVLYVAYSSQSECLDILEPSISP